jgi:hypothetical protein
LGKRNQKREPISGNEIQLIEPPQRSTVVLQKYKPSLALPPLSFPSEKRANPPAAGAGRYRTILLAGG